MGSVADAFNAAFRDYVVDGNAGSGINQPAKSEARALGATIEAAIAAVALQSPIGRHTRWIPARTMVAQTTNGAASGTAELATNKTMLATFDFDQTTQEYVQFDVVFEKAWDDGTFTGRVHWTATTGAGSGVVWEVEAKAVSDNDPGDGAWGTAVDFTADIVLAANREHITSECAAITPANGPVDNDRIIFRISRKTADAGDNLAADAKLIGVELYYTTEASTDA